MIGASIVMAQDSQYKRDTVVKSLLFQQAECQYPNRSTNPINGCDNSDPCDPENAAKGGTGECKAEYSQPTVRQDIEPKGYGGK